MRPGGVGVGCDDWVHSDVGELGRLLVGQGGAEWSDPDVASAAGQRNGDGIHRAFHDDRDRSIGELVLNNPKQLRSLVEQRCFAGVEVFRSGSVDIAEVGMPSTNESEHLTAVDDREDLPGQRLTVGQQLANRAPVRHHT